MAHFHMNQAILGGGFDLDINPMNWKDFHVSWIKYFREIGISQEHSKWLDLKNLVQLHAKLLPVPPQKKQYRRCLVWSLGKEDVPQVFGTVCPYIS